MAQGFRIRSYIEETDNGPTALEGRTLPDGETTEIVFCRYNFPILPVTRKEAEEIQVLFSQFLRASAEILCVIKGLH